jgi:hypothetical protein
MKQSEEPTPPSSAFVRLFSVYLKAYFARHFTALRISDAGPVPVLGPNTILYSNHPSWWDPIVMLLFATGPLGRFRVYAPIEAAALSRYPILSKLGLFGIDTGSVAGTRRFIELSNLILQDPGNMLVTTAQGRFADVRERPAGMRNGVAHLLHADPNRVAVPVALEYVHWNNRLPEALVAFGPSQRVRAGESLAATTARLDAELVATLETLGAESILRDPGRFQAIVGGQPTDVNGIYTVFGAVRRAMRRVVPRRGSPGSTASGPRP